MARLRLLIPFPALVVWRVLLIRWQPVRAVPAENPMHRGTGNRHLVEAFEISSDPPRPEVILLPQIQDLAHDLA
jgi:hypothetical protein